MSYRLPPTPETATERVAAPLSAPLDASGPTTVLPVVAPGAIPRGPWGAWLRLTAPRPPRGLLDARTRERLRRGQLLSVLFFCGTILLLAFLPRSFLGGLQLQNLVATSLGFVFILLSALLNRFGHVTAAGAVLVLGVAGAVALSVLASPGGLSMVNRVNFHLFVIPIVIAGILLPYRASILLWLGCVAFILLAVTFMPHSSDMTAYMAQVGVYGAAISPLISTSVVALVSGLAARSVERAILEADRTHELERAYQLLAEQKRRLEEGVAAIQAVHARAANGDLSARSTLAEGELVPLAVSLNLMLDRLARSRAAESALGDVEQRIQRLAWATSAMAEGQLDQPLPTGSWGALTPVVAQLEHLRQALVRTLRQTISLSDRVNAGSGGLVRATRALGLYLQQHPPQDTANPTAQHELRDIYAGIDAAEREAFDGAERLRQFLAGFRG